MAFGFSPSAKLRRYAVDVLGILFRHFARDAIGAKAIAVPLTQPSCDFCSEDTTIHAGLFE
jgi:hypothetical protein